MKLSKPLAIAVTAVFAVTIAVGASAQKDPKPAETELRKLMTQKRDLLQRRVSMLEQTYLTSDTSHVEVVEAKRDLIKAQLDLAETHSERLEVLTSQLELCRELERVSKSKFQLGDATQAELLHIMANRIDAEIALLLEKQSPLGGTP